MKKLLLLLSIVFVTVTAFGQATGYVITNFATSASIGTAATTVDVYSRININQTTAAITLTVPNPTNTTTKVSEIWVGNIGTATFTLSPGGTVDPNSAVILKWTGSGWYVIGKASTGGGGGAPTGAAGGDLSGTYPNPTVAGQIVKSVVLNTPNVIFTNPVTFSTATNTATGTLALNTQAANTSLMGPISGGVATPTFRTIGLSELTTTVTDNSELTIKNNKIVSTGYTSADILRDPTRTITTDNGSLTLNAPYGSLGAYNFKINGGRALSLTGSILWIGQDYTFCQLSNFFPQTGGQGEVGDNTRRYGSGYINTFISNIIASSSGLTLGAQEVGGVAATTVGAAGTTSSVTLRTADNTGTGASGSVFIYGGTASGGGASGNIVFNATTVPVYQGMVKGTYSGNVTTAPSGSPSGGYFNWSSGGDFKLLTSSGAAITLGLTSNLYHLSGSGIAPTIAAGVGAGTSPTITITKATDLSGVITVTTGTLPSLGATVVTVTFNTAYTTAPKVTLYNSGPNSSALNGATMVYVADANTTTTTFAITSGTTALTPATTYIFTYTVIQ